MATTLTRWHPFSDVADLRDRLDRIFELGEERVWAPRVDLLEEENELVLRADLPGIAPDEIEITVEDDVLTVSGEHEEREEEKGKHFVRKERRYGSFARSVALPKGVSPDDIEASCEDGVLEVKVPLPEREEKGTVRITPKASKGS